MGADWRWLASTKRLQRVSYGWDWDALGDDVKLVAASLKDNVFAALIELGEASREFHWKPWSHDAPWVHRDKLIGELVDVAHFIGNMLVALRVTDEEWEAAYQEKQEVNRQRQIDKYTVEHKERT